MGQSEIIKSIGPLPEIKYWQVRNLHLDPLALLKLLFNPLKVCIFKVQKLFDEVRGVNETRQFESYSRLSQTIFKIDLTQVE